MGRIVVDVRVLNIVYEDDNGTVYNEPIYVTDDYFDLKLLVEALSVPNTAYDLARAIIAQKVRLPAWLVQLTSENPEKEVNCKFIDVAVPEKYM